MTLMYEKELRAEVNDHVAEAIKSTSSVSDCEEKDLDDPKERAPVVSSVCRRLRSREKKRPRADGGLGVKFWYLDGNVLFTVLELRQEPP
mmetsp:Transcript_16203/g.31219  ORF Transcript_16203/g.31219 Transcript_16203/m.31219 type:complete len:90 (+) Transcript_16203:1380-1649(+)